MGGPVNWRWRSVHSNQVLYPHPLPASSVAILKVFQWLTYWTYRSHRGSVGKLSRKVRQAMSSHDHRELCLKRTEYSWGWGRALCKPTRSLWARPACRCWSVASAPPPLNCQQNQPLSPLFQINTKSQHDFFLITGFTLLSGKKKVITVLPNYMSISRSLWIHDCQHWIVCGYMIVNTEMSPEVFSCSWAHTSGRQNMYLGVRKMLKPPVFSWNMRFKQKGYCFYELCR